MKQTQRGLVWLEQFDAGDKAFAGSERRPPVEASNCLAGIRLTGRWACYTDADTWFLQWGSDDALYSPWTDGVIGSWASNSKGRLAMVGYARVEGDNPLNLTVAPLGTQINDPHPYEHRYPGPFIVHDGTWYYGTYVLDEPDGVNILGPFVGFRVSTDQGRTWDPCPHTPNAPIFGESTKRGTPVRLGSPRFVDFGKNMELSPDGKAYLIGHGSSCPQHQASWASGDAIFLGRVSLGVSSINDPGQYEFFAGHALDGSDVWTNDYAASGPIFSWPDRVGPVSMTFSRAHDRYLMWITAGGHGEGTMDSYLLEAKSPTGPWRWVTYLRRFGVQGYFLNFPSRFLAVDGSTGWLCYSANHSNRYGGLDLPEEPPGSGYGLCLQEAQLLRGE